MPWCLFACHGAVLPTDVLYAACCFTMWLTNMYKVRTKCSGCMQAADRASQIATDAAADVSRRGPEEADKASKLVHEKAKEVSAFQAILCRPVSNPIFVFCMRV